MNVFVGPQAMADYLNPDKQPVSPLVELPDSLHGLAGSGVRVYAKLLNTLPLLNSKSLPAYQMLEDAWKDGRLTGVESLVENSSGNTVASLAVLAQYFGVGKTKAYVSHEVSRGKLDLLQLLGIAIEVNQEPICPDPHDVNSGVWLAKEDGQQESFFNPGQYDNQANPKAHYRWTGPQIWRQLNGRVDMLVAGLGTTGTLVGAGRYLKEQNEKVKVVGVHRLANNPVPGVRTPKLLEQVDFEWREVADELIGISTEAAYTTSLKLCRAGIWAGPSSGFALAGVIKSIKNMQQNNSRLPQSVVVIFPDSPLPYLSEYQKYVDPAMFPPIKGADWLLDRQAQASASGLSTVPEIGPAEAFVLLYGADESVGDSLELKVVSEIVILDVRSQAEFDDHHLFDSWRVEDIEVLARMEEIKDRVGRKTVVVVCASGQRSVEMVELLIQNNIKAVNLIGGTMAWSEADLPRWRPESCAN